MKIAIASSGLGHVARGIETWALDTAVAVSQWTVDSGQLTVDSRQLTVDSRQLTVDSRQWTVDSRQWTVDSGQQTIEGRLIGEEPPFLLPPTVHCPPSADIHVTLFCAAALPSTVHRPRSTVVLPCLKRSDRLTRLIACLAPGFTWRWGWKSVYDIEQRSFWRHLWPILRDEKFDILHVQDPLLADLCRQYRQAGKLKTKEILAHGTEESPEFLSKFDYVQHLAPWHLNEALKALRSVDS